LEQALKQMALWVGANPEEVRVSPNTDFVEDAASPEQALKLVEARNAGLPISLQSIHEWASKNEFTQKTWEDELAMITEDAAIINTINGGAPVDPTAVNAAPALESNDTDNTEDETPEEEDEA
jgi:hypothetical protein